jgi:hypothetical protein
MIGACVLSASGTLPLHLMSFVVAFAARDGRLPVAQAGWIGSAFWLGMLGSTVALPLAGIRRVTVGWVVTVPLVVCAALALSIADGGTSLLIGWLIVGGVAGLLAFLGSTSAAGYRDPGFVFTLRLALVLLSSAATIGLAGALGVLNSYVEAIQALAGSIFVVCAIGLVWYRPPPNELASNRAAAASPGRRIELAIAALFFAGQSGFSVYAAHFAITNGIDTALLAAAYAGCKVAAAIVLLKWGPIVRAGGPALWLGGILGIAIVVMASSSSFAFFAAGLLGWEVALNLQATRMQTTIVSRNPAFSGVWIAAAIAFGASIGPAVHGLMLSVDFDRWFLLFSVASGFVPAIALRRWRSKAA